MTQALSVALPSYNFPRPGLADGTDTIRPATLRGLSPDETLRSFTTADGAWLSPAQLDEGGAGNIALDPQIAMDASGNAFAVRSQDDGTQFRIQANRFA